MFVKKNASAATKNMSIEQASNLVNNVPKTDLFHIKGPIYIGRKIVFVWAYPWFILTNLLFVRW